MIEVILLFVCENLLNIISLNVFSSNKTLKQVFKNIFSGN